MHKIDFLKDHIDTYNTGLAIKDNRPFNVDYIKLLRNSDNCIIKLQGLNTFIVVSKVSLKEAYKETERRGDL